MVRKSAIHYQMAYRSIISIPIATQVWNIKLALGGVGLDSSCTQIPSTPSPPQLHSHHFS
jgi:hypothetical protein